MNAHPLEVIAREPPSFDAGDVADVLAERYRVGGRLRPLVSERDQNFRVTADDGEYVFKIANAAEDPAVVDFQLRALEHIEGYPGPCPAVPVVCRSVDGADRVTLSAGGMTCLARLVTWVEGVPLDTAKLDRALDRALGGALAELGQALAGFRHAGGQQPLLWDLQQAPEAAALLPEVRDRALRRLLEAAFGEFLERALPSFPVLRRQVIHHDFHSGNVLLDPARPASVAGVIDFGDMQEAPLVADVAVACAYLRSTGSDPLEHAAGFVEGYHAVTPLTREELGLVYDMVGARLATTLVLLEWRKGAARDNDAWLGDAAESESDAAAFLETLRQLGRERVTARLAAACEASGQPVL